MKLNSVIRNTKFYQSYSLIVFKMTIKNMVENTKIKKWECLNILNYIHLNINVNLIQSEKYLYSLLFKTIGMRIEKDLR